jgi:hypothetical protein
MCFELEDAERTVDVVRVDELLDVGVNKTGEGAVNGRSSTSMYFICDRRHAEGLPIIFER